jgi:hypothetical protein
MYSKSAIVCGELKEALLYFDHIVPINLGLELAKEFLSHSPEKVEESFVDLFSADTATGPTIFRELLSSTSFRAEWGQELLPPRLAADPQFLERLFAANQSLFNVLARFFKDDLLRPGGMQPRELRVALSKFLIQNEIVQSHALTVERFIEDYGLNEMPIDCSIDFISDADNHDGDIIVKVKSLRLITTQSCSWEQLLDLRRDTKARDKLRRLRLFAYENYRNKPRQYVEDDIQKRIADYETVVTQWGFTTTQSTLNMLFTSKALAGGLAGSLISALFGAPTMAVVAATGGLALELGQIALEVGKQRFALRKLMAENPVSYIGYASTKLNP